MRLLLNTLVMNDSKPNLVFPPDSDLGRRRSQIRRGLRRANLAAVTILIVVISLSLGAVLQAFRAERNARDAERSQRAAERELEAEALALMQQARAERRSGESNLRSESLEALARAASLRSSPALLDEAIAVLALPALQFVPVWTNPVAGFFQFAPDFGHLAIRDAAEIKLLNLRSATNDITLPSVGAGAESFWFSPDGRFLDAVYFNGSNIVWNLSTRSPVLNWGPRWRFEGFSSDSARVIVLEGPATLRCLALADGQELWHCQTGTTREYIG